MRYVFFLIMIALLLIVSKAETQETQKDLGPKVDTCCGYYDPGNPYPCSGGNCTWWCSYKRPDLPDESWGNACNWLNEAIEDNFPTGSSPQVESIAVFASSFYPPYGHVAYVESVAGGSFGVTEMGWEGPWGWCVVHSGSYSNSHPDLLGFIYKQANNPCGCGDCDCSDCCVED